MSRQTAMPRSGYRHNRRPRSQQMDLFGERPVEQRYRRARMVGATGGSAGGAHEPDDAVDPRSCCDDSDAAREGGQS